MSSGDISTRSGIHRHATILKVTDYQKSILTERDNHRSKGDRLLVYTLQQVRTTINPHIQVHAYSCVPSSVEMALKILGSAPANYYTLQNACNPNGGCFTDHNGQTYFGTTFRRINLADRGDNFPFGDLFNIIDTEIDADKLVMIALPSRDAQGRPCYHGHVIFKKNLANQDYNSITKIGYGAASQTRFYTGIKNAVREIEGTDILVHS